MALVLAILGPAYAVLSWTPAGISPASVSPGAAPFLMPLNIKAYTQTPPAGSVPGYGDTILSVEVGRDDKSPFVAIVLLLAGGGPNPNPVIGALGPWFPTFPPGSQTSLPDYPAPAAGDLILRLIYRPTNDPVNPGWVGLSAGPASPPAPPPTQLDGAWATCMAVAAQLDRFRAFVPTPMPRAAPALVYPWIYLEFDPNGASPTFLECYKLQIVR